MAEEPKFRRHIFLIKKEMQFRYARLLGTILLAFLIITQIVTWVMINSILPGIMSGAMSNEIKSSGVQLLIGGLVYIIIIIVTSIYFSHRIAGPVFRLEKDLNKVSESCDLTYKFFLREKDELKDIVIALNNLFNCVRGRLTSYFDTQKESGKIIGSVVEELNKSNLPADVKNRIVTNLQQVNEKIQNPPLKF